MNNSSSKENHRKLKAEFDLLADEYHDQHKSNIAITGEDPEFFSEYKIADVARLVHHNQLPSANIFDFGSGIGNSLPHFRKHFPNSSITCGDVSERSIEIAKIRFPGNEDYVYISDSIPLANDSQDIVFTACVFHHIPHAEHKHWLEELRRITRPGGLLIIFEHNPYNPLTVRAVNTCPLDVNAKLITASTMSSRVKDADWSKSTVEYKLFFPSVLRKLRRLERNLTWLPLGAQYRLAALKPV
jgi:SAM-dependent methyltransferase